MTNAAGLPTQYGYDADHELSGITYALTSTPTVTYTYTASGQRQTMTDGTGTSTDQYSPLDQVITSTNGAGASVGDRYDPAGNLSGLVYPDASAITRTYDAANRLTGITDWLGHSTSFSYDAADRLITQTYPNTTTATFSYNAADQLSGIVDHSRGVPFWTYGYTRDAGGNISAASDPLNGSDSYAYDAQSRLSQDQRAVSGITATTSWADDAAGEIRTAGYTNTSGAALTDTLTYDVGSQLSSLQAMSGTALTHNYVYTDTATGARSAVSDTLSAAQASYSYDQADRLTGYNAGFGQFSYGYDGDGLRQSKALSGTVEAYTWDTAEGLPQLLQDGSTRYVLGPDGLPLEQVGVTGTVLYYYQDQLGSTRALINGAGQGIVTYAYNAFGSVAAKAGSATNPFGYAGQYTDPETGFQYLQARYYDPATSQFLTRDPLVGVTGQPYAYAYDDPLNAIDPAGLDALALRVLIGACNGWPRRLGIPSATLARLRTVR